MAIIHAKVQVNSTTPVEVTNISGDYTNVTISIQNLGTGYAYIGAAGVSSSSYGFRLESNTAVEIDDLGPNERLYVIHQDATADVALFKVVR